MIPFATFLFCLILVGLTTNNHLEECPKHPGEWYERGIGYCEKCLDEQKNEN